MLVGPLSARAGVGHRGRGGAGEVAPLYTPPEICEFSASHFSPCLFTFRSSSEDVAVSLICISLMTHDVLSTFSYLREPFVASFVKCLLESLVHFYNLFAFLLLIIRVCCLFWTQVFCQVYCEYFLLLRGLLVHVLNGVFRSAEA